MSNRESVGKWNKTKQLCFLLGLKNQVNKNTAVYVYYIISRYVVGTISWGSIRDLKIKSELKQTNVANVKFEYLAWANTESLFLYRRRCVPVQ